MADSTQVEKDALRVDAAGALSGHEILDNGYLRAPAYLTRVGVFTYRRADGSTRRELRSPEEVFKPESVASFSQMPLTDDHPYCGRLDAENTKTAPVIGSVGESLTREGRYLKGRVLVTDGAAVKKILGKEKSQLSCGYLCDFDPTPGVWQGESYDGVQRNIRGNHVALVKRGRAGPDCGVRLDNSDAEMVIDIEGARSADVVGSGSEVIQMKFDGVDCEVADTTAQLIKKEFDRRDQATADATKKSETTSARADALEAELKSVKAQLAEATKPEKLQNAVKARVALERKASEILPAETKFDDMSDEQIRAAVVQKVHPGAKLDNVSPDYLSARYDAALEIVADKKASAPLQNVRVVMGAPRADADVDAKAARAKFMQEQRDAWKAPLTSTKK